MPTPLKRLLLVAGRHQPYYPYKELLIKHRLEESGVEVRFAIPGRSLNKGAEIQPHERATLFQQEQAILLHGEGEFRQAMRGCQMVAFSTWRSYLPLTRLAQAEGRLTLNFSAATGIDHWTHGVERCLIRSPFTRRLLQHEHKTLGLPLPPEEQIREVGSLQYEAIEQHGWNRFPNRESFCLHYGLNPQQPIAVLFPKGIQSFRHKVTSWFPEWTTEQMDQYHQQFLDKYGAICRQARKAGCNLLVNLHPSSQASYNCNADEELAYWTQHPWAKPLAPEHSLAMYRFADVGIGINTHSSLDMGYFKKPFIYVDSDQLLRPDLPSFDILKLSRLPPGPSSHWHTQPLTTVNPWFPSWLGAFSRMEELADLLTAPEEKMTVTTTDWEAFMAEHWGGTKPEASQRIVTEILHFAQERLSSWRGRLSPRRRIYDLI
ncbi:MAG: hypothetical protein G8237_11105 [Magnetococcales bacterium]|nr:hypothetical protein [Magnetococcales bacterium]NGZ06891.1 hypothetical protein [Magnetococcales bacterium]